MFWGLYGSKTKKIVFWDFSEGAKKAISRDLILWSSPIFGSKNPKKIFEIFFSKRTSRELHFDHFWDPRNHMGALESMKKSKKSENFSKHLPDPPRLLNCVIWPDRYPYGSGILGFFTTLLKFVVLLSKNAS